MGLEFMNTILHHTKEQKHGTIKKNTPDELYLQMFNLCLIPVFVEEHVRDVDGKIGAEYCAVNHKALRRSPQSGPNLEPRRLVHILTQHYK